MDGDRGVPGRGPSSREITAPIRDTSNPQPRQEPHSALYHFSPTVSRRQHHTTSERSNRSWNQRYLFAVVSRKRRNTGGSIGPPRTVWHTIDTQTTKTGELSRVLPLSRFLPHLCLRQSGRRDLNPRPPEPHSPQGAG